MHASKHTPYNLFAVQNPSLTMDGSVKYLYTNIRAIGKYAG